MGIPRTRQNLNQSRKYGYRSMRSFSNRADDRWYNKWRDGED